MIEDEKDDSVVGKKGMKEERDSGGGLIKMGKKRRGEKTESVFKKKGERQKVKRGGRWKRALSMLYLLCYNLE